MRARLIPLLVCLIALFPACSGDDDGSGGLDGADDGLGTIGGALTMLPASGEETETVVWGDMARAAEIAGLERPDDPADTDAVVDYVQALTAGRIDADTSTPVLVVPPEAVGVDRTTELEAFVDEVGWSVLQVDRFVERQTPPDVVTVLDGRFDEGAISDALGERSDGLWVAGDPDNEDFAIDPDDITVARPLGESLWFDLDGDRLTVARSRGSAEAVGDEDRQGRLADDESFAALAAALDAERPYAAMLVRPGLSADPLGARGTPEQAEAVCDEVLPEPTTAVATGVGDDDGPVYLVALAHRSAAAATANAEALEDLVASGSSLATNQPWSDMVTLDDVEVTGDDRVVVARLRPTESEPPALWYQIVYQRDALVSSCG